jgi:hypothetical protein
MWEWYRIGVAAGIGTAVGVIAAAWLAGTRLGLVVAPFLAAAAGVAVGIALDDWNDAVAGAIGGLLGGIAGMPVAAGALRRGGTRAGTGILVALAGLGLAALALIPFVGYLEAVALPALAARTRRREPERYAGLRSLARD